MSDPRQPHRIYRPESLVGTLHDFMFDFKIPLNASPSKRRLQELMLTPKITEEPKELDIELKSKLSEISLNSWTRSNSSTHYSGQGFTSHDFLSQVEKYK